MDNQELAAAIAAFLLAHGAGTAAVLWKAVQFGVKRLIEWERMIAKLEALERQLEAFKKEQEIENEKLSKDINAAFSKLRT